MNLGLEANQRTNYIIIIFFGIIVLVFFVPLHLIQCCMTLNIQKLFYRRNQRGHCPNEHFLKTFIIPFINFFPKLTIFSTQNDIFLLLEPIRLTFALSYRAQLLQPATFGRAQTQIQIPTSSISSSYNSHISINTTKQNSEIILSIPS